MVFGLITKLCLTLAIPQTVAHQASLFMGFPRQEYWSGLPFPSAGDLPHPGIKPRSTALQADSLLTELRGKLINRLNELFSCNFASNHVILPFAL